MKLHSLWVVFWTVIDLLIDILDRCNYCIIYIECNPIWSGVNAIEISLALSDIDWAGKCDCSLMYVLSEGFTKQYRKTLTFYDLKG